MNTDGLNLTILLISIAAPIGALDVLYYHVYKFRLARRPASRTETITHVIRSLVLAAVTAILVIGQPGGLWFWLVAGLLGADLINSAADALLERDARADLGGLPRLEYLVHILGATLMGAITISFVVRGAPLARLDTGLTEPAVAMPALMRANAVAIAVGGVLLAAYETAVLLISSRRAPHAAGAALTGDQK